MDTFTATLLNRKDVHAGTPTYTHNYSLISRLRGVACMGTRLHTYTCTPKNTNTHTNHRMDSSLQLPNTNYTYTKT